MMKLFIILLLPLMALAQNRVHEIDADKLEMRGEIITATELGHVAGSTSNIQVQIDSKASQADHDALAAEVTTKAEQADLDALSTLVDTKANQTDLDDLSDLVDTKAPQSHVDILDNIVNSHSDSLSDKQVAIDTLEDLTDQHTLDIATKANDADVVHLTGNETIAGDKTFTDKIIVDSTTKSSRPCPRMTEAQRDALTPANGDCIYNTDKKALNTYDSTVPKWKVVGEGSGSGGFNYIENSTFDDNIEGWNLFRTPSASDPTKLLSNPYFVVGTQLITFDASDTAPLMYGARYGLITKPSSNAQREGIAYKFKIQPGDKTKVLKVSFEYETSANYVDGDIRIYLYKDDDALTIEERVIDLPHRDLMASSKGTYTSSFQADATNDDYYLVFYISSTSTLAYTVKIDEVKIDRQSTHRGQIVQQQQIEQVSTQTTTFVSNIARFQNIDINKGAGLLSYTDDAINGTRFTATKKVTVIVKVDANTSGTNSGVIRKNGTSVTLGGIPFSGSGVIPVSANFEMSPGDHFDISRTGTGVTGFSRLLISATYVSDNVVMSEDAGTREIDFEVSQSLSQSVPETTWVKVALTSAAVPTYDSAAGWDSSGTRYIIPESGTYDITGLVGWASSSNNRNYGTSIYVNGSNNNYVSTMSNTGNTITAPYQTTMKLNKGDILQLYAYQNDITGTTNATILYGLLRVLKRSSPQTIAASETVSFLATSNSGQPIGTSAKMIMEDVVEDSHAAYNSTTGYYDIPISGLYYVSGNWHTGAHTPSATSSTFGIRLAADTGSGDATFCESSTKAGNTTSSAYSPGLAGRTVRLKKGDKISLYAYSTNASSMAVTGGERYNHFSITRVGN